MKIKSTPVFREHKVFLWDFGNDIVIKARTKSEARASFKQRHGKIRPGTIIVNVGEGRETLKVYEKKEVERLT